MNRVAVFVEGQTEQLFIEKLISEIAGAKRVQFERVMVVGRNRAVALQTAPSAASEPQNYVLIVNSASDSSVASDVRENYDNLVKSGYSTIVALRDVYPKQFSEIPALRRWMGYGVKTKPISVSFVLAIMEIEAWFLSEHTHFLKLHADLTAERIVAALGIDPRVEDMTQRPHPAEDLHNAYATVGLAYTKRRNNALRTINAMDYAIVYATLAERVDALGQLVKVIDQFLTAAAPT
jgi:hypothetical protein